MSYEQIREQVLHLSSGALNLLRLALSLPSGEQQKLLAELKERRPSQARQIESRDYSIEQQWLRENRHLYPGQYLAVSGNQLLAHGTNAKAVVEQARASRKDFLLARVLLNGEIYGSSLG